MRSWLKPVSSFGTALYQAVRSRPSLALLFVALVAVTAVASLRFLEPHRAATSPPVYRPANRLFDEEQAAFGGMVASRRGIVPSSSPPTNATDAVSDGWGRRIIRRATLDVELADVEQGVARLTSVVESVGGFISSTETQVDQKGTARATVTAYIPPAHFARVLGGLDGVGRVTRRSIGGQDVSEEFVDLEARLRNFERHEAQLLSFMGKAQKVQDLLSLENELARVRGEIERTAGRLRFLKARTDLATIQVALVRAPLVVPPDGLFPRFVEQVKQAFAEGWSTAFALALAAAVLAAQLSPLAIPALCAWVIYRRRTGRRSNALTPPPLEGA
ncbi:MAG TPA: DUF4349 domain-containing protein [Methylomirabilota bacterium]|jgi:hypothetical protein|nr:DUF4349 domain-containing protein [Methylomirabilota bacterium]